MGEEVQESSQCSNKKEAAKEVMNDSEGADNYSIVICNNNKTKENRRPMIAWQKGNKRNNRFDFSIFFHHVASVGDSCEVPVTGTY